MEKIRYFSYGFIQHLCTFNIVTLLFITFCKISGRRSTPSARPSLLMFRIDRPIARISSSLVLYRVPRSVSFTLARDRNRIDSYRLSTVDVPESPIISGARGPWQQQRSDFLHCHEEWWGSVQQNVATCFTLSLKTFLCSTTSCHFNFDPGTLL